MTAATNGKTKALSEPALHELEHCERMAQHTIAAFIEETAKGRHLASLIQRAAKGLFEAEHLERWHRAIREVVLSEAHPEATLEGLLEELERQCEGWPPTNSTSLIARAEGDSELAALRTARKQVRSLLRINAKEAR